MSNFTSFLGGALRAVNDGIARNREYEKEQEKLEGERDFLREQNQFKAGVQREIARMGADATVEAARLRQKNANANRYTNINGHFKHLKRGTEIERIRGGFAALASDPEKIKELMNDANQRGPFIAKLGELVSAAKNHNFYASKQGPMSGDKPELPVVWDKLHPIIGKNSYLSNLVKQIETGQINATQPKGQVSQSVVGGQVRRNIAPASKQPAMFKAAEIFQKSRVQMLDEVKRPEDYIEEVKSLIGSGWNKYQKNYEGNNKYWSAASSPFVAYISGNAIADSANMQAAKEWLYNREHGFIHATGDKKGQIIKEDIMKLVKLYGKQNSSTERSGYNPKSVLFESYLKDNPLVQKAIESRREAYASARTAHNTWKRLRAATEVTRTGSGVVNRLMVLRGGLPEVISGGIKQLGQLVKGLSSFKLGDAVIERKFKNTISRYNEAQKLLTSKKNLTQADRETIAAARVQALEMTMAYQLTAILQGGTGGRTISDTDVTRTLSIFGGDAISFEQKMAKLNIVGEFIDRALTRGQFFSDRALPLGSNAGMYDTYLKVEDIIRDYKGDDIVGHFVDTVERKYMEATKNAPLDLSTNTFGTMSRRFLITKIADSAARGFKDSAGDSYGANAIIFNREVLQNFIDEDIKLKPSDTRTLGIIRDEDTKKLYVLNIEAFKNYGAATTDKDRDKIKKDSRGKKAYDLMSGKVVNVEYGFSGKLINGNRIPQISFIDPETAPPTTSKNKPQAAVQSNLGKPPVLKVKNARQAASKVFKSTIFGGYDTSAYK